MPPSQTLCGRGAFESLFACGQRANGSLLRCLFVLEPDENGRVVVGFAVPKRTGGAVKRNRAKRLMREAYRREEKNITTGLKIFHRSAKVIFVFKPPTDSTILAKVQLAVVHHDMTRLVAAILSAARTSL